MFCLVVVFRNGVNSHTNTKYIEKAKTLPPDVLEQIEKGEVSISEIMRAEKTEALESQKKRIEAKKIQEKHQKNQLIQQMNL